MGEHGKCAVKVIRSNETMAKAAMKEVEILRKLGSGKGSRFLVGLKDSGTWRNHVYLVMELSGSNLREVLNKYGLGLGLSMEAVKGYSRQLLAGLAHMGRHGVVHADLKPDNILVSQDLKTVKVADLGSAGYEGGEDCVPTPYLVSRFYRAPEIVLGMQWGRGVDLWSLGCTAYELATGRVCFGGRDNNDMLMRFMVGRGMIGRKTAMKHRRAYIDGMGLPEEKCHFEHDGSFREWYTDKVSSARKVRILPNVPCSKPIRDDIVKAAGKGEREEAKGLGAFLEKCLTLDESKRGKAEELMEDKWIKGEIGEGQNKESAMINLNRVLPIIIITFSSLVLSLSSSPISISSSTSSPPKWRTARELDPNEEHEEFMLSFATPLFGNNGRVGKSPRSLQTIDSTTVWTMQGLYDTLSYNGLTPLNSGTINLYAGLYNCDESEDNSTSVKCHENDFSLIFMKEPKSVVLKCKNPDVSIHSNSWGCVISADGIRRVFVVSGAAPNSDEPKVTFEGIIVTDGWAVAGGGLGIDSGATVNVVMCTFFQNIAWGQHIKGGAIVLMGASTSINLGATIFWENDGTYGASDIYAYSNETIGSNPIVEISQSSCLSPYNTSVPKMGPALEVEGQNFVGALNSWICFPDGTFNNLDENDGDDVDNPKAGAARAAAWHFGTVATVEAVVLFLGLGWWGW
ncbi:hypothetical protein TrRE_jg1684 [Triparma retinervis]|uniref:Protein kinase domain-containing protein n=1 Tax=Triparma retinervis TaxID=2557542 RepID=A0A9W6ZY54_9STRA|nr:hypothetical protein TrRE_jg1684 [Triparma retinervis]